MLGHVVLEITEDRVNLDSESDSDGGEVGEGFTVGTGTYSVKMRLNSDLPQFVPIHGKRIRLYYRGIKKLCTNCLGGHLRKNCSLPKVQWVEYFSDFMSKYDHIPEESYGKWSKIVKKWRAANLIDSAGSNPKAGTQSNSDKTRDVIGTVSHAEPQQEQEQNQESSNLINSTAGIASTRSLDSDSRPVILTNSLVNQPGPSSTGVARMLEVLRSNGMEVTPTSTQKMGAVNPVLPIPPFKQKKAAKKDTVKKVNSRKASI
jgi:hypothetical protein